jgi:hypothetical protein
MGDQPKLILGAGMNNKKSSFQLALSSSSKQLTFRAKRLSSPFASQNYHIGEFNMNLPFPDLKLDIVYPF